MFTSTSSLQSRLCKPQFLVNVLLIGFLVLFLIIESRYSMLNVVYKQAVIHSKLKGGATSRAKVGIPTLTMFTSWSPSPEKALIYRGTLQLWQAWQPEIVPILFSSDTGLQRHAQDASWIVLPERTNPECKGPPLFPAMFTDSMENYDSLFYGFANADIAFGNGLMETLSFLAQNETFVKNPYLIIGKRTYFNFDKYQKPITSPNEVKCLMTTGELIHWSSDYFITSKNFPWKDVDPLSIGRPLFCRWIIAFAIISNIPVIDTSRTIEALHMTTKDGNRSSWVRPGLHCNKPVVQNSKYKVNMQLGRVECVTLETYFDKNRRIQVRSRRPCRVECPAAYNNITSVWDKF